MGEVLPVDEHHLFERLVLEPFDDRLVRTRVADDDDDSGAVGRRADGAESKVGGENEKARLSGRAVGRRRMRSDWLSRAGRC